MSLSATLGRERCTEDQPTKGTHSGDFTPKERGTETASEGSCSRGMAQFHWGLLALGMYKGGMHWGERPSCLPKLSWYLYYLGGLCWMFHDIPGPSIVPYLVPSILFSLLLSLSFSFVCSLFGSFHEVPQPSMDFQAFTLQCSMKFYEIP